MLEVCRWRERVGKKVKEKRVKINIIITKENRSNNTDEDMKHGKRRTA